MTGSNGIAGKLGHLLKGLVAFLAWELGLILGSSLAALLGIPTPPMPEMLDTNLVLLLSIPAGVLISVVLGVLWNKLALGFWERFLTLFAFNFLVYGVLQVLEQLIFTTTMNPGFGLVSNLVQSLFLSMAVTLLWRPERAGGKSLRQEVFEYFSRRRPVDWALRIILSWLAYVPIYYIVGTIISPLVEPFYTDQSLGLGLALPEPQTILGVQVIRGALFLLAVFPLLVLWKGSTRSLWLWMGLAIFVQIAATPMILAHWLPIGLRIPHAIELTVDSFVQAYVYSRLLGTRDK